MKRDIYQEILNWKQKISRKPLIIRGARQVGKTYIIKEFAANEYENIAYLNFEENPALKDFFAGRLSPVEIIEKISIFFSMDIRPESSLIFFDEIQEAPRALTSLKYFCEDASEYNIIAAGSLLGIKVGRNSSFPVGKVNFLNMYPFTFGEFLDGIGETKLRQYLHSISELSPIEPVFHDRLIDFLKKYFYIGGMPEVINSYRTVKTLNAVREIQNALLISYENDFAKHASVSDAVKLTNSWRSIPEQLAKENKKFKYSLISKYARARDYNEIITWLVDAGLVYKSYNIKTPKLPLSGFKQDNIFKLFLFDTGLLGALLHLPAKTILETEQLFREYNGAFTENFISQELAVRYNKEIYYWTSGNTAEVDFVIASQGEIFPLEVKAGRSAKKKSLKIYGKTYGREILSRATLMNFKRNGMIYNYPLYAISLFPKLH